MSGRRAFICVGRCAALQQPIDLVTVVKYRARRGLEMRVATVTDARQNDLLEALPGADLAHSRHHPIRRPAPSAPNSGSHGTKAPGILAKTMPSTSCTASKP